MKQQTGTIQLNQVKLNDKNPRKISQVQLDKLKKSIQEFPEMLNLRPIVLNEDNVILGGNMRIRALKELGYTEVPYLSISDLPEDKQQEFVIKDNLNYGEWNWDVLQDDWQMDSVLSWGLEAPVWMTEKLTEPMLDEDVLGKQLDNYLNQSIFRITMFFDRQQYETTIKQIETLMKEEELPTNTDAFIFLMNFYLQRK